MTMFKRKHAAAEPPQQLHPAVIPAMDRDTLRSKIITSPGGPCVALLVYANDDFEIVSGLWSVLVAEDGLITYWVADRMIGIIGRNGEPEPVPNLRSLMVGYRYPLGSLMVEAIPDAA